MGGNKTHEQVTIALGFVPVVRGDSAIIFNQSDLSVHTSECAMRVSK